MITDSGKPIPQTKSRGTRPTKRGTQSSKSRIAIAHRRARLVFELERHPGISMPELAARFKISEETVRRDFLAVRSYYEARVADSREAHIGEHLRRIDATYAQADEAWAKSCKPKTVETIQEPLAPAGMGEDGKAAPGGWKQKRNDSQHGDGKLLAIKLGCIGERAKLLGLYAPIKASVTVNGYDIHAVVQEFANLAVRELSAAKAGDAALGRMVAGCNEILARAIGATPGAAAKGIVGPAVRDADEIEVGADGDPDGEDDDDLGEDDGLDELADPDWGGVIDDSLSRGAMPIHPRVSIGNRGHLEGD